MRTSLKNDIEFFLFDNQEALLSICKEEGFLEKGQKDFLGMDLPDWAAVLKQVDETWESALESVAKAKTMLRDSCLKIDLKDCAAVRTFNSDGDGDIDIDRWLDNRADVFMKIDRQRTVSKNEVTICIDLCAPATIDPADVYWRGAAGLALAEILEEKSYKTEIWTVSGSTFLLDDTVTAPTYQDPLLSALYGSAEHTKKGLMAVNLKQCKDPFDVSTLVNNMGGWFFRSAMFCARRSLKNHGYKIADYDWRPFIPSVDDLLETVTEDENVIVSAGFYDLNGAVGMLKAQLELLTGKDYI